MNSPGIYCRWPPAYNFEDLGANIKDLLDSQSIFSFFYSNPDSREPDFCQGDIVELETGFPFIDSDGDIAITEGIKFWLIVGNTCDLSRDIAEVEYTEVIPLDYIPDALPKGDLTNLKHYRAYRRFYIPDWEDLMGNGYLADFTMICCTQKEVLTKVANRVARLDYRSWVLLHACLVRYLARDDGRHD